ncbi:hypothetical protein ACU8KH_02564 [Lachancea thermotolerans]
MENSFWAFSSSHKCGYLGTPATLKGVFDCNEDGICQIEIGSLACDSAKLHNATLIYNGIGTALIIPLFIVSEQLSSGLDYERPMWFLSCVSVGYPFDSITIRQVYTCKGRVFEAPKVNHESKMTQPL